MFIVFFLQEFSRILKNLKVETELDLNDDNNNQAFLEKSTDILAQHWKLKDENSEIAFQVSPLAFS